MSNLHKSLAGTQPISIVNIMIYELHEIKTLSSF